LFLQKTPFLFVARRFLPFGISLRHRFYTPTMLHCSKWAAFIFVYIAALSRCNFVTASATRRTQLSRNDLLHPRASNAGPFCTSALRNLTDWKSSLYRRTMDLYKATERRLGAVSEPPGHARFSLFSPFVTCINQGTLMRVGNNEDGKKVSSADTTEQE